MIDSYTIKWTTPHCVLTLRLIGLAFDVYDGRKKQVTLSALHTCIFIHNGENAVMLICVFHFLVLCAEELC